MPGSSYSYTSGNSYRSVPSQSAHLASLATPRISNDEADQLSPTDPHFEARIDTIMMDQDSHFQEQASSPPLPPTAPFPSLSSSFSRPHRPPYHNYFPTEPSSVDNSSLPSQTQITIDTSVDAYWTALFDIIHTLTLRVDDLEMKWIHEQLRDQPNITPLIDQQSVSATLDLHGIHIQTREIIGNGGKIDVKYRLCLAISHLVLCAILPSIDNCQDDSFISLNSNDLNSGIDQTVMKQIAKHYVNVYDTLETFINSLIVLRKDYALASIDTNVIRRAAAVYYLMSRNLSSLSGIHPETILILATNSDFNILPFCCLTALLAIDTRGLSLVYADRFISAAASSGFQQLCEVLLLLESTTDHAIVPQGTTRCISFSMAASNLGLFKRISLINFVPAAENSQSVAPVSGYWMHNPFNDTVYFRNLACPGGSDCELHCRDIYDAQYSTNGSHPYILAAGAHKKHGARYCGYPVNHKHDKLIRKAVPYPISSNRVGKLLVPKNFMQIMIRRGIFERRFEWWILCVLTLMMMGLLGILIGQNWLLGVNSFIDIRHLVTISLPVLGTILNFLNQHFRPETALHDFLACKSAIVKFSDAAKSQSHCVGCYTAALLHAREDVSAAAAGPNVNLIGQTRKAPKTDSMYFDRPGTTTCLHRTGFYFIQTFHSIPDIREQNHVVEKNVQKFTTTIPSDFSRYITHFHDGIYVVKRDQSLLVQEVNDNGYVAVIAIVDVNGKRFGRLNWLETPLVVKAVSTPYTSTYLIS